ncbi:MAG TPA: hypothetical protein VMV20_08025 [Chitinophagaceae bacterium]|nr:hypothetical protein [Chitinophagaceae bacterium]
MASWSFLVWIKLLLVLILILGGYYAVRTLLQWIWNKMKFLQKGIEFRIQIRVRPEETQPRPVYPNAQPVPSGLVREQDLFGLVYRLSSEINQSIQQAAASKLSREELLAELRARILPYLFLKTSPYRFALDNLLSAGCERVCAVHLSGEELDRIWRE